MSLAYYVEDQNEFKSIYQYSRFAIEPEEIIAHQLCEFHIIEGHLYELRSNEMDGEYDQLIVDHVEASPRDPADRVYPPHQIHLEFRRFQESASHPVIKTVTVPNHIQAMRFLVKDKLSVPDHGVFERDSCEVDLDRNCYVIYLGEEII
ncbi:hypothetical protein HNY42_00660 [Exiguobacterium sp. Helios]|nr:MULTISPECIES: hypothetical protein [unclassified Exiguobacterium]QNR19553.1 hypothetical protein HNY42_00660 [Exiguobacterium sp. Helios]RDB32944.1 hypothetical protein DVG79_10490 [Exiguobacterium sp. RIT594]